MGESYDSEEGVGDERLESKDRRVTDGSESLSSSTNPEKGRS